MLTPPTLPQKVSGAHSTLCHSTLTSPYTALVAGHRPRTSVSSKPTGLAPQSPKGCPGEKQDAESYGPCRLGTYASIPDHQSHKKAEQHSQYSHDHANGLHNSANLSRPHSTLLHSDPIPERSLSLI